MLVLQCPTCSLPGGIGCATVSRSTLAGSMWASLPALGWRDVGGHCGEGQDRSSKTGKLLVGRASSCARLSPSPGISRLLFVIPGLGQLCRSPQSQPDPSCHGSGRAEPRRRARGSGSCPGRPPRAPLRGHGRWVRAARAARENAPSSAHAQALGLRRLPPAPWLATARPGLPAPTSTGPGHPVSDTASPRGWRGVLGTAHCTRTLHAVPCLQPLGTAQAAMDARGDGDGWDGTGMAPGWHQALCRSAGSLWGVLPQHSQVLDSCGCVVEELWGIPRHKPGERGVPCGPC